MPASYFLQALLDVARVDPRRVPTLPTSARAARRELRTLRDELGGVGDDVAFEKSAELLRLTQGRQEGAMELLGWVLHLERLITRLVDLMGARARRAALAHLSPGEPPTRTVEIVDEREAGRAPPGELVDCMSIAPIAPPHGLVHRVRTRRDAAA